SVPAPRRRSSGTEIAPPTARRAQVPAWVFVNLAVGVPKPPPPRNRELRTRNYAISHEECFIGTWMGSSECGRALGKAMPGSGNHLAHRGTKKVRRSAAASEKIAPLAPVL